MSHLRALKLPLEMWQKIPIISYLYAKIIHRTLLKPLSIPGETQLACFSQLFDNEPIGKSLQHLEMEKKELESAWFLPNFLHFVFIQPHISCSHRTHCLCTQLYLLDQNWRKKASISFLLSDSYTRQAFDRLSVKKFAINVSFERPNIRVKSFSQ